MPYSASGRDRAVNILMAILGGVLFISPWLLGYSGTPLAAWNAWLSGAIAAFFAIMAASRANDWQEWLDLIIGLWIAASPWLLGFYGIGRAAGLHLIIGLAIVALAALELRRLYQGTV